MNTQIANTRSILRREMRDINGTLRADITELRRRLDGIVSYPELIHNRTMMEQAVKEGLTVKTDMLQEAEHHLSDMRTLKEQIAELAARGINIEQV